VKVGHRQAPHYKKPSPSKARVFYLVRPAWAHSCGYYETHWGLTMLRDQNSACEDLIDAHTPGTGVAARLKPLAWQRAKTKSVTRETPATTTQGV